MSESFLNDERLMDLLIQQATSGLGAEERAELERLAGQHSPDELESIEHTVAALTLAARLEEEPLPEALRMRLLDQAAAAWDGRAKVVPIGAASRAADAPRPRAGALPSPAWWVAAASILVAAAAWYPRLHAPAAAPDDYAARAQRLAAAPGVVDWRFTPGGDATGSAASGDVLWDPKTQRGFMRLRGLAANDARRIQYQLWIFDAARDARYPVDGGVFDVPAHESQVVIPIAPRLPIDTPTLFAVTVERPGGVVVSTRERIAVIAKPKAG